MFADRRAAGTALAAALAHLPSEALVLAIPRGGVEVARAVADALGLELDVVVVRKLGAPRNPELAIGAVGPDGVAVLDPVVLATLPPVDPAYVEAVAAREGAEIERRLAAYRGERPALRVEGRVCVIVDDGLATGSTARAALLWVREHRAARAILAVPVAPGKTIEALREIADEVVCLETPSPFQAVGQFYRHFEQLGDDDVVRALATRSS